MSSKRFALSAALILLLTLSAGGQSLDFERTSHAFGSIREDGGSVRHTFAFTNPGPGPVVIERVEVSCGCTSSDFSRKPVMAGKKGEITVIYDPLYRPGPFSRTAVVTANNRTLRATLTLTGEVIERTKSVEELFPVELGGGLRASVRMLAFRNVAMGSARSMTVGLANTSSKALRVDMRADPACPFLKIAAPAELSAGERAEATLTFDFRGQTTAWGVYSAQVWVSVGGRRTAVPINAIAYGVDDFGEDPDTQNAPRVRFEAQYHDFGDVSAGLKSAEFTLTNSGNEPLHIRYVRAGEGLTCEMKAGETIRPGAGRQFAVTLDTAAISPGAYNASVTVITDDPLRPLREIRLVAYKK